MKRLTKRQMRIFAVGQLGWSTLSGIISMYNEKKVMATIEKHHKDAKKKR